MQRLNAAKYLGYRGHPDFRARWPDSLRLRLSCQRGSGREIATNELVGVGFGRSQQQLVA